MPIFKGMGISTQNRLNIAFMNTSEHGGGAESCVRSLHEGLDARGHRSTLWVGRPPVTGQHTRLIPDRVEDRAVAARFARKGFFSLGIRSSCRFSDSTALDGVDIIHLHNVHGHYFSLEAVPRLARRASLVWTLHDFFPITGGCAFPFSCERWKERCGSCPGLGRYPIVTEFDRTRRMLSIKRSLFRDVPVHIVTPSRHLSRAVLESKLFSMAELHVIPYGTDLNTFVPAREASRKSLDIPPDATVVAIAAQGLDDPRKGVHHAIESLRHVENPRLTVLLMGGGDVRNADQALSQHDVRRLGYVHDRNELAKYLAAADLFVFTSLAENYPCIVQEAMACGTPVLGFDIAGVNEQIQPDATGFLTETGNARKLSQRLRELLRHRARLHEVGSAARQYALREWGIDRFLDRHEIVYHHAIATAAKQHETVGAT